MHEEARAERRVRELDYWTSVISGPVTPLFEGALEGSRDIACWCASFAPRVASRPVTERLLSTAPGALRARLNDLLIAAFGMSVSAWRRRRGRNDVGAVLLDVEGHGREEVFEGVDLSHTVGWFTSLYPLGSSVSRSEPAPALKRIKEQLRSVPDNGFGYGLLRYLNQSTGAVARQSALRADLSELPGAFQVR